MLENLKNHDLNCNVFSVYDYDGESLQELLCQFYTKINECVDKTNESSNLINWLVGEGLSTEVAKKLVEWHKNGELENIINQSLLNKKEDTGYFHKEKQKEYTWNEVATVNDYYDLFDSLATPSRLNYTVLGKDQSGTYDIRLYDYKPTNYNSTVFVTCAIHGWEHFSTYTMYEVFKTLLNDKELPKQYKELRNSRILCIPIVNPWGLMADNQTGTSAIRRGNSRGVDINRNFDYKWSQNTGNFGLSKGDSAFSEVESQYIKQVFDNYEISFFLDIHSFYKQDDRKYLFYSNPQTVNMTRALINWLNLTYGNMEIELTTTENDSSANNYSNNIRNTRTCNIELIYDNDKSINDNGRKWHECILNYLSLSVNNFKHSNYMVDSGAKFAQRESKNSQSISVGGNWTVIDNLSFTYDITQSGIYEVNGFLSLEITGGDSSTTVTICPTIGQELYYTPKSKTSVSKPYIKSSTGVHYIPFNCSMYVKKGMGQAKFQLEIIKEGNGTVNIKRSDAIYKFLPCNATYVYLGQHNKEYN